MNRSPPTITLDRRSVLRGTAVGAAGWVGLSATVSGATARSDADEALLVLIYDDSPVEDYRKTFPVHQEYDVPGCVAVCPGLMETGTPWLRPGHLEEMYDAGWEVMSHTNYHRPLGAIPVRSDVEEGDTEIHVQASLHGRFEGDPLVIYDPQQEATATVAGRTEEDDDEYLLLEEPIDASFDAGDGWRTWVRYTEEFIEDILADSRERIEDWGFGPVTAYVHTYDRYDGYVSEVVDEYYEAVPNRHQGALNPTFDPDPHQLSRANYEEDRMDIDDLEDLMDTIATEPDFGILYGHSNHEEMTEERIAETIELAQDRDIRIVTLQEALVELGVWADETGQPAEDDDDDDPDDDDPDDTADEPDDDDVDDADDTADDADDDDETVGFGVASAVAGMAGAGYLLARRRSGTNDRS